MSYTIIPDLPLGGIEGGHQVDVNKNLLVIEQDITRKITPLSFLANSIPQLTLTTTIKGSDLLPISNSGTAYTSNLTINNLMNYINTHLNVIDVVFFVSSLSGVDATDYAERGRNEQLPYKTIKFAAQQISKLIAKDPNYLQSDPNLIANLGSSTSVLAGDNTVSPNASPNTPPEVSKKVRKQYTIMVRSGDYVEINPVYLPPNTSMIGDNLRRTTIRPANPMLDLFWVDSANYIWGFTFRDHKAPAAAVAFPICTTLYNYDKTTLPLLTQYAPPVGDGTNGTYQPLQGANWLQDSYYYAYLQPLADPALTGPTQAIDASVIPNVRPYIYVSPYTQGCTSYAISDRMPNKTVGDNTNNPLYPETWYNVDNDGKPTTKTSVPPPNNAGMGMRIDGSLVNGYFRSMVIDSYTQINQGGRGVHLLNHGYAQFVSTFTVATSQGIVCEAGGTCSVSTSNSTFGLSGLVATGKSYSTVLSGKFIIPGTSYAYPASSASLANGNTYGVYGYTVGSNLFTINGVQSVPVKYPNDPVYDINNPPMYVAGNPYATLCFTVGDDQPWDTGNGLSGPGYLLEEDVNPAYSRTFAEYATKLPAMSALLLANPSLSTNPMHQVKLFYIEQGAPTPALSGGTTSHNGTYDIYQRYPGLSIPSNPNTNPNQNLPWDINLSYNLSLDLQRHVPIQAYDAIGIPLHYNIDFCGNPVAINYKYYNNVQQTFVSVASGTPAAQSQYVTHLSGGVIDFTNAPVKFYARSVIETGSHTFEYMGTGTRMKYAIPAFGGVTQNGNEAIADGFNDKYGNAPGTVFFTSSNELGNFKVGTDFTIVQSTGTIQGDTFSRAILTLVTPLNIVLE
jgi:hypothetical protein